MDAVPRLCSDSARIRDTEYRSVCHPGIPSPSWSLILATIRSKWSTILFSHRVFPVARYILT